jgi:glycosyltransferase involved in cell wall biosynthesis
MKEVMNICITNIDSNPLLFGGIKRVSSTLANEWKRNGHQVFFLSQCTSHHRFKDIDSIEQYFLPNANIVNCKENMDYTIDFIRSKNITVLLNQFSDSMDMSEFCIAVKDKTGVKLICALHFHPNFRKKEILDSFWIKDKLGHDIKAWIREGLRYVIYKTGKLRRIEKATIEYYTHLYNQSNAFVVLSESYKKYFYHKAGSKLHAIPNPIIPISSDVKFQEKEKNILWSGRIDFGVKRIDRIIDIWGKMHLKYKDWHLYILGEGYLKNQLSEQIKQKGINNMTFVGFVNPEMYYKNASILCLTSSCESFGMVLVEAQQYGCIPIAYNSYEAINDIIEDNVNGFKVEPFRQDEFIHTLSNLMENETQRKRMFYSCLPTNQRFDVKNIASQWIELFFNC